ncbi:MAG: hypothetical protein LBR30_05115, partial [Clostridioides sp.]|nr:hypothetical protein [Clostridioides sp.]
FSFSNEYSQGTDNIIFTSKYGRKKLAQTKILAGLIFSISTIIVHIFLDYAMIFICCGFDGFDLSIQLLNLACPYRLNMLQASMLMIFFIILMSVFMSCFTLFVSSISKKSSVPIAATSSIVMITYFLHLSEVSKLWNRIYLLLPKNLLEEVFSKSYLSYFSYEIFGRVADLISMRIGLYILLIILTVSLTIMAFRRHQIY